MIMTVFQVGVVAPCSLVVIQDTVHDLDCNSYCVAYLSECGIVCTIHQTSRS